MHAWVRRFANWNDLDRHLRYGARHVRLERNTMAEDQKPADQMEAFSKDAMAQAHQAIDTYFDFLEKSVASFPSGGTDFGEKLKVQSSKHRCSARACQKVESSK